MKKLVISLLAILMVLPAYSDRVPRMKPVDADKLSVPISPRVKRNKWGFADAEGKFLIRAVFDLAEEFKRATPDTAGNMFARVTLDGKSGLLKRDGTYALEPVCDKVSDFVNGVALFVRDGSTGLIDREGRTVVETTGSIDLDPEGYAWVQKDGAWTVYRNDGVQLGSFEFDEHSGFFRTVATDEYALLARVKSGSFYGIVTPSSIVTAPSFPAVTLRSNMFVEQMDAQNTRITLLSASADPMRFRVFSGNETAYAFDTQGAPLKLGDRPTSPVGYVSISHSDDLESKFRFFFFRDGAWELLPYKFIDGLRLTQLKLGDKVEHVFCIQQAEDAAHCFFDGKECTYRELEERNRAFLGRFWKPALPVWAASSFRFVRYSVTAS